MIITIIIIINIKSISQSLEYEKYDVPIFAVTYSYSKRAWFDE